MVPADVTQRAMSDWVKEVPEACLYYMGVAAMLELERRHRGMSNAS